MERSAYLAALVVLLTLAVSSDTAETDPITTEPTGDGVRITCSNGQHWEKGGSMFENGTVLKLEYNDGSTGEYVCMPNELIKIYVKFRTCDNCIDLEVGTLTGIIVGEVMATALIGVAVYLLASQPQGKAYRQSNKASDRQNLVQNDHNDTTYQPLTQGHSSEYSQLEPRRARR